MTLRRGMWTLKSITKSCSEINQSILHILYTNIWLICIFVQTENALANFVTALCDWCLAVSQFLFPPVRSSQIQPKQFYFEEWNLHWPGHLHQNSLRGLICRHVHFAFSDQQISQSSAKSDGLANIHVCLGAVKIFWRFLKIVIWKPIFRCSSLEWIVNPKFRDEGQGSNILLSGTLRNVYETYTCWTCCMMSM